MVANNQKLLGRVLKLSSSPLKAPTAKQVLDWNFSEKDRAYVSALLEKNSRNTISTAERQELETLVTLGNVIDLLHAEATLSLHKKKRKRERVR